MGRCTIHSFLKRRPLPSRSRKCVLFVYFGGPFVYFRYETVALKPLISNNTDSPECEMYTKVNESTRLLGLSP